MKFPVAVSLVVTSCLMIASAHAGSEKPGRKSPRGKNSSATAATPVAPDLSCKEPAAVDPGLIAGLAAYNAGKWPEAFTGLSAWAARPEAETDPAAGRGLYSLSYAARVAGNLPAADKAAQRAEPLLRARIATAHSVEGAYYLQAIYQMRGDEASQLGVISATLKAVDAGTTCKRPGADDLFRIARMRGFAGNRSEQLADLEKAAAMYAADPTPSPYRAITEREIGQARLDAGDVAGGVEHLAAAARLEPTMSGVHRAYGIALIKAGKLAEASEWWKTNWRNERDNGNSLIYAIPVLESVVRLQPRLAASGIQGLSDYTTQALELNSEVEAKRYLEIAAKRAEARKAGGDLAPDDALAIDVAELRMSQLLVAYVAQGMDLQEFALQKGLLPAILRRELPKR